MSTVVFIRRLLDAGFSHDEALRAAEAFEATLAEMFARLAPTPQQARAAAYNKRLAGTITSAEWAGRA